MIEPKPKPPIRGVNDLATLRPDVAAMWHPAKNDMEPYEIMPGARRNIWWLGSCGHEWYVAPRVMTRIKNGVLAGCPVCKGRQVVPGINDLLSQKPEVGAEWHPDKNEMTAEMVTPASAKLVWWLGKDCDHSWQEKVCERTRERRGKGCRVCFGMEVTAGVNDLATTHPEIAKLWHSSKNSVSPSEVMAGARMKKYWWTGKCGHEWETIPRNMTSKFRIGSGCPYCCGKKILVGFNDLATTNPVVATEWHPTKNGDLKPTDISQWYDKYVWWVCSKNSEHVWETKPRIRGYSKGCPKCVSRQSIPERELYEALKKTHPDAIAGHKMDLTWGKMKRAEVDIFLPSLNTMIEYDGWFWHLKKFEKDTQKTTALIAAGYKVIRVRAKPLEFLDMQDESLVQIVHDKETAEELADNILKLLEKKRKF